MGEQTAQYSVCLKKLVALFVSLVSSTAALQHICSEQNAA
jgi:hypothetical protein